MDYKENLIAPDPPSYTYDQWREALQCYLTEFTSLTQTVISDLMDEGRLWDALTENLEEELIELMSEGKGIEDQEWEKDLINGGD